MERSDDNEARRELLALTREVGEYLTYFRELGVDGMETDAGGAEVSGEPASRVAPEISAAAAQRPQLSRALARNAVAGEQSAAATESPALSTQASTSESIDMAKRTSKNPVPDEATPPPQETLFGVITPKDELSLPRPNETLEDIWADIGDCTRCPLHQGRTHVVNSEGNQKARLMFVGEAPGADEDAQARPFVGRAGQLLNKIIEAIGMKREEVFIGNVNRCRPPQNRTPTPAEAATCKPFLLREIAIVQPAVIVVLGNTAMKNLLDTKEGITKLRGQFQDYRGIKVMPTFHPAYLLRDPTKKRETWEDMKKVREYLDKTKP
ncbi:MAG TPA: uracil-DNA glycosylase [Pyrinomonadaceae bacterium]|nr:uracil-DNA glycosylase [Pyrinomonadaceae bacterium]